MHLHVNWLSPIKCCFAKILALIIKIWTTTIRIEISQRDIDLLEKYSNSAKICALWHNRLFIASELFQRYFRDTKMDGLISPSKDGAWLTEIYKHIGIHSVRGSTKRGGKAALSEMASILGAGGSIALTPDGPRGPKYVAKPGIAALAKETNAPIILASITIAKAWRFNSWDQFYLPKPFSHVTVKFHAITAESYAMQTPEELLARIQDTLYKINAKNRKEYCFA
jgi:lysophospholipid acyltransferase (LPLAT)-like uncharacterized protein